MESIARARLQRRSPLTGDENVSELSEIPTDYIIEGYAKSFGIDVSSTLTGVSHVKILRCNATGFKFYFPFNLAGDGKFYEELQQYPWYYMGWKWEHRIVFDYLETHEKVLEIGCARGDFLKKLAQKVKTVRGLELNERAASVAKGRQLQVEVAMVEDHARANAEKYDTVCSFQVLEHIADVKSFLQASIAVLKPGGKLIVCVPNNDSFIKNHSGAFLNMPPHHMGLWDKDSLQSLTGIFPLRLNEVFYEPLQCYHYQVYLSGLISKYVKHRILAKILNRCSAILKVHQLVHLRRNKITGHSILVIFNKL